MEKRYIFLLSSFIILFTCFIYGHTLNAGWHFDDYEFIVLNERVHDLHDMSAVWRAGSAPSRFIAFLSFAINYHFHQLDVTGYHVVNISIHLINAFLVWIFIFQLFQTPMIRKTSMFSWRFWCSWLVAMMFLTHPLQTQAVTYITQRFASLASMFYLMALILYLHGRLNIKARGWCMVSAFCVAILGMFTKQIVLTLPFMILLIEGCFFHEKINITSWRKGWRWWYAVPLLALFVIIPSVYGWRISYFLNVQGISRSHTGDIITYWTYFLTQFRVIPTYIRLLFFPIGQTLDYDFQVSTSIFELKVMLGFLFLAGVFLLACRIFKHNRLAAFGIFWFFLTLSVESSLIPILQVIFEHRCYFPSIGFFLTIITLLFQYVSWRRSMILCGIILSVFTFLAHQRNDVWQTEISLWEDINRKVPQKVRSYIHLGVAYLMEGRYTEALNKLNQAVEMEPDNYKIWHNRGIVYNETDQLDAALENFQEAIRLHQHNPEPFNGRGAVYAKQQNYRDALRDYNTALELRPHHAEALYNRGQLYLNTRQYLLGLKDLMAARHYGYPVNQDQIDTLQKYIMEKTNR